jgi:type III secretion system (T3SS) SseB-like protein
MTFPDAPADDGAQELEAALASAVRDNDQSAALEALGGHDLILPQADAAETGEQREVTLPVIEQDEKSYVPAFTTVQKLSASLPAVTQSVSLPAVDLAAAWPSDELWLAINPGDESTSVALPSSAFRTLAPQ